MMCLVFLIMLLGKLGTMEYLGKAETKRYLEKNKPSGYPRSSQHAITSLLPYLVSFKSSSTKRGRRSYVYL